MFAVPLGPRRVLVVIFEYRLCWRKCLGFLLNFDLNAGESRLSE